MFDVISIILGGGQGSRLYPLTRFRSKPAVPLGGKYRLIDIPISNCLNSDLRAIFVLTQFNSESLNRHVTNTYRFDMFSQGFVQILAAEQTADSMDWFQGTADAVRKCLRHIDAFSPSTVLILSGDQLYRMDFRRFLRQHEESRADITVATIPVRAEETGGFGILKVDPELRIVDFAEKPPAEALPPLRVNPGEAAGLPSELQATLAERPFLASMGIYAFQADVLRHMLADESCYDFGKHLIPTAIHSRRVFAHPHNGYWSDIGTIASFFEANLEMARANPPFNPHDARHPIFTNPRFLPPSKIFQCRIHSSSVAEGCVLSGAVVWNSVVGIRSRIGNGTEIRESLIMGADFYEDAEAWNRNRQAGRPDIGIGSFCVIRKAIIDKNCRIGDNVHIINRDDRLEDDGELHSIRDGIVIIPKDTVIPDGTVI